jgi:hypothetical protein
MGIWENAVGWGLGGAGGEEVEVGVTVLRSNPDSNVINGERLPPASSQLRPLEQQGAGTGQIMMEELHLFTNIKIL